MAGIPEKPTLDGIEDRWSERWQADGVYRFDRTAERADIFSLDTPPPTVSGSIHMGTVFGYTQFDSVARFQRMRGKQVFFPIGWDDNGLATERRVQNYYGVRCDPTQPFDAAFEPPFRGDGPATKNKGDHREIPISRPNFIALCEELTAIDESVFEELLRRLGMSFDWSLLYTTVGDVSRRASQLAFLRNLERGEAYSADAPTVWDVDDRTAVAQAEIEDRETAGAYHRIAFHGADADLVIETSRPELIVSCCALVAHPDDERYQPLFGTTVRTPLFGVEVPVVAHRLAQPDKGTGIAMICTFGDVTDVTWWRELRLPTRNVIGRDGRILAGPHDWLTSDAATTQFGKIAGLTVKQAQAATVAALRESGELLEEPKPITHPVKFYERGRRPLEIVTSRQWYIRNGGRDESLRDALIARGKELDWHPDHMRYRYENWVEGLNGDWLISRQRFFGVPIPLWYPVVADGQGGVTVDHDHPITPAADTLPIDPQSDVPPGFTADQRWEPGGFAGDPDIMDTWATSSVTPHIAGLWADDAIGQGEGLFERVYPMDVRPQGPEIIRTWLFGSVVRAHFEHGGLPWSNAMINGWILDPDRKKMSKSKGNVVTPMALFETYGSDAVRYWSLAARPGVDTAFSEDQMKVGRRFATKLLNVSKFVLGIGEAPSGDVASLPVDAAMLARLDVVVAEATRAFEGFDYARALERTEEFFWWFCDDYVELVKSRAYGTQGHEAAGSARHALRLALSTLQRLLAPVLPFAAEEAWSWWHDTSVHIAAWPTPHDVSDPGVTLDAVSLEPVSTVLGTVRRAKTESKVSQRAGVATLTVSGPADWIAAVESARADLVEALTVAELITADAADVTIVPTLAEPAPA